MIWKRNGINREVFLIGKYAIKIPSLRTYRHFIAGLLCNMNERNWWKFTTDERLCPVLFALPGGFVIVMARATALGEYSDAGAYADGFGIMTAERIQDRLSNWIGLPVEPKPDSFGVLNGQLVAIDYGDDYNGEIHEG